MTFLKVLYRGRNYPESKVNLLVSLSARCVTIYQGKQMPALLRPALASTCPATSFTCDVPPLTILPNVLANTSSSTRWFGCLQPREPKLGYKAPAMPRARSSTKTTGENHQYQQSCTSASLISAASLSDDHSHPHECCHPTTREAPCGTARYWEAFAGQQQLGVSRNQYILQWREAEPSSGPPPPWHKGIWNVDQEQSSPLIKACFVQWKMCNIGFTSWIPNCLAIFPSASPNLLKCESLAVFILFEWLAHHSVVETRILHHCCVRGQSQLLCSHALVKFNIHLHVRRTANFHRPLTSLPLFCCAGCFLPILLLPKARQLHHQPSQTQWLILHTSLEYGCGEATTLSISRTHNSQRHRGSPFPSPLEVREIPSSSWQTVVCWLYIRATSAQQRDQLVSQRGKEKSKGGSFSLGAKPRWSTTLLPTQIFGPYNLLLL